MDFFLPSYLSELVLHCVCACDLCLAGVCLLWVSKCWLPTVRKEWEGRNGFIIFCILFYNDKMDFQLTLYVLPRIKPQNPICISNIPSNAREFTVKTEAPLLTHYIVPGYCCTYCLVHTRITAIGKQKQVNLQYNSVFPMRSCAHCFNQIFCLLLNFGNLNCIFCCFNFSILKCLSRLCDLVQNILGDLLCKCIKYFKNILN